MIKKKSHATTQCRQMPTYLAPDIVPSVDGFTQCFDNGNPEGIFLRVHAK